MSWLCFTAVQPVGKVAVLVLRCDDWLPLVLLSTVAHACTEAGACFLVGYDIRAAVSLQVSMTNSLRGLFEVCVREIDLAGWGTAKHAGGE